MYKFLLAVSILLSFNGLAQTPEIDSLKLRLKTQAGEDTIRAIDLNELSWQFLDYSADSSGKYVQQALTLSQKIGYLNGIIDAKNVQGILFRYANESDKAIALYEEIIRLRQEQGREDKLTGAYSNLGSVYYEKSDNANALRYYLKSYNNATKFGQIDNQLTLLNNVGAAYKSSGLNDLAIESFKKGLELNKTRKDEYQEGQFSLNLGTVYDQQGLFSESIKYLRRAYETFKKKENVRQLSIVLYDLCLTTRHLNDLKATGEYLKEMQAVADVLKEDSYYASYYQARANYYTELNRSREALDDITRSLALTDTVNEVPEYGSRLLVKANIYYTLKNYVKAMEYCEKGQTVIQRTDEGHQLANAYDIKSDIYHGLGDFKSSLNSYKKAVSIRDSLDTESFNTKMATLNAINELDRKESELQLSIREKESIEARHKQQSAFLTGSIIIALLVLTLLVFSVRAYRIKKRDNQLLNNQKQEIQLKNTTLEERQVEIESQKRLVEEKQKEILDSIHYARRIQNALMASRAMIDRNLTENFILFKPKDIVSGDFYWCTEKDKRFYLAVCDSTGHGVPGAFMSLLNISFLNEAINEKNIREPNLVLDHVRSKLISSISHDGAQDGMDCALLCFDRDKNVITYAAAQNGLLQVRGSAYFELPADKMPVGKGQDMKPFTLHSISYDKGDLLYLYSDGYADQFGGPKGKKFKYRSFQEQLILHAHLPLPQQEEAMNAVFEAWRGNLEQIDDVVLMGIRL